MENMPKPFLRTRYTPAFLQRQIHFGIINPDGGIMRIVPLNVEGYIGSLNIAKVNNGSFKAKFLNCIVDNVIFTGINGCGSQTENRKDQAISCGFFKEIAEEPII